MATVRSSRAERGFTLIELMITVAIVGVLAVLAVVGYSRWTRSAKTAEATAIVGSIKGQQDTYRAETLRYLDCTNGGMTLATTYPAGPPTDQKMPYDTTACGGNLVCLSFRKLNVSANAQVYYVYSCEAGNADGSNVVGFNGRVYGVANDVWNVVRAKGDLNNDGIQSNFESSSFDTSIWSVNADE